MSRTPNARPTADNVDPPVAERNPVEPTSITSTSSVSTAGAEASTANAERQDELVTPVDDGVKTGSAPFVTGETIRVKTSGNFNLMDPFTGKTIDANDDANKEAIPLTEFIKDKLATGELVEA